MFALPESQLVPAVSVSLPLKLKVLESVLKPSHCVKNDDVIEWEHEET